MASSGAPWPWGLQPPYYPSPLERGEGDSLPLGLEGEGRSWGGGGGRGAPWRPHEWEEKQRGGEPQTPPSMEGRGGGRGSCEASQDMVGRKTAWGPPRVEETEERGSWRPTTRGPQEPPREYWSPEQEGREDSCEPPQKRFRSPPVGEWQRVRLNPPREDPWESLQKKVQSPSPMEGWWRVPLSPPRERGSTSASSQRQPSSPSSHAPHWEPVLPRSSGRGSPSTGGNPWVSQGRSDGPETESWARPQELSAPSWEPCRDLEMPPPPASRGTMEERDLGRSKWLEEPASGSSSSHQRSRGDPGWGTRPGNPVDGSYSVKAGGNRESWSGTGFQTFQSQIDSREQDYRGLKGWQGEGWTKGLSRGGRARFLGSPRESIPQKDQGAEESLRGNLLGPRRGPQGYEGRGTQGAAAGTFFPCPEVVNYWRKCHHIMSKNTRDEFLSFCPRPYIQDRSFIPPIVNPQFDRLIGKYNKALSTNVQFSLYTQWEVLNMLVPAMALYEMTEAAMERQEGVDPLAVGLLARCLLSFAGSTNRRLTQQRCFEVFRAIDPRLESMVIKMSFPNTGGWLFAEDNVDVLKGLVCSLETLPQDPPERNSSNHQEGGRPNTVASPVESTPQLPEPNTGQKAQLQDESSVELWHRRFGHTNSNLILRLQRDKLVTGIKVSPGEGSSTAKCITCFTGVGPATTFRLNTVRNTTALMDLVHCELSGPFDVPSLMLQRYVLIFVEDFSRFCVSYLMKETSEMHGCFESYLALLRTWQKTPKAFQMNSAADAVSPETLSFLKSQGIAHKRGVKSVPGKSRTAEKEMKSILITAHRMLADAMLPEPFWCHAIPVATYLQNRLPIRRSKRTRFQDWFGAVPNVKHLRVFGSLFRNRQKAMDNAQHVFVGYSSGSGGYQFMNLETGAIIRRRTKDLDEGKAIKKRGKFVEAIERHANDIEALAGIVVSMMSQPEKYTTPAGGETREETSAPADGNGGEED